MTRIDTILKHHELLLIISNGINSKRDLVDKFDRSSRTITRYIRELEDADMVVRQGSSVAITSMGEWYAQIMREIVRFHEIETILQRSGLPPARSPPYWIFTRCDTISSPAHLPQQSIAEAEGLLDSNASMLSLIRFSTKNVIEFIDKDNSTVISPGGLNLRQMLQDAEYIKSENADNGILNLICAPAQPMTVLSLRTDDGDYPVFYSSDSDVYVRVLEYIYNRMPAKISQTQFSILPSTDG